MSLTATIGGTSYPLFEGSFSIQDALDQRTVVQFDVRDDTGNVRFKTGQAVSIADSTQGTLFTGFVFDPNEANIYPNATNRITVTCMDNHYLFDKRVNTNSYEFQNAYGGDIFAYLLNGPLSSEGLSAGIAYRRDTTTADFATGTLTNAVATSNVKDGDLEIASSGSTVTATEQTATDWSAGNLTNMQATSNGLMLASTQAIALYGTAEQTNNNNFVYWNIWNSGLTLASGYTLQYDVWVSSTSPQIMGGVDGICSDGTSIRDYSPGAGAYIVDQQGLRAHPNTDLSGYANDQWYTRTIDLSSLAGKTLSTMSVALEGDTNGAYKAYFRHIKITNGGTTIATIFETTQSLSQQIGNNGYSNVTCGPVTVYERTGTRVNNGISLNAAGVLRSSLISWQATLPLLSTAPSTSSTAATIGTNITPSVATTSSTSAQANGTLEIDISWDNVTWLVATNHAALPGLIPGSTLSAKTLYIRQIMTLGTDPTVTPVLTSDTVTILPSYAPTGTKTDVVQSYGQAVSFSSWTQSSITAQTISGENVLTFPGSTRNWDNASYASQTLYGTGSPYQGVLTKQFYVGNTINGGDVRSRFDFAGQWSNFVLDVDIYVNTFGNYSFVYRTTGWQNANNTHAYSVDLTTTQVILGRGTNTSSGGGSFTSIQAASVNLSSGNWHHLQIIANGSSHSVYVDGVLYISATDSTYTAAGYVGARFYNTSGVQHSAFYNNFGISSTTTLTGNAVLSTAITIAPNVVQSSVVVWNATAPSGTTVLVEGSFAGGSYYTLTNGGTLPSLISGSSPGGLTLKIRVTLTASSAGVIPIFNSLSFWVASQLQAQGTRVSPALSLSNVANAGSSSVSWNAVLPNTSTTLQVQTSFDNISYSVVSASGNAISGITTQTTPYDDSFASNTSSSYTSTYITGGSAATWTYDTTNSRLTSSGGSNGIFRYDGLSFTDGFVQAIVDESNNAGLVIRMVDQSNLYVAYLEDSTVGNYFSLWKVVAGTYTQLGASTTFNFVRGTYHVVQLKAAGTALSVSFDGTTLLSVTDSGVAGPGKAGLMAGTLGRFYDMRVQGAGQNLAGKQLYLKTTLYTTDPTVTPQLLDITTSVRGSNIASGALIPTTAYYLKTCAAIADDTKNQSGLYWWYVDKNKIPYFQPYTATLAPWVLNVPTVTGVNGDILVGSLTVDNAGDTYYNTCHVEGGVDTTTVITETRYGDGVTQAWPMSYPLAGVPQITLTDPNIHLDGVQATVGIRGQDTGKQFYYQQGNNTISLDASLTPPGPTETITFVYYGQVPVIGYYQDTAEVARRAALDGTSGIVEVTVSVPSLINKAAANAYAQMLVQRNEVTGGDLKFKTLRTGLAPGQLLTAFIPQHGIADQAFLVLRVKTTVFTTSGGNLQYVYEVEASAGPNLGNYMYLLKSGLGSS